MILWNPKTKGTKTFLFSRTIYDEQGEEVHGWKYHDKDRKSNLTLTVGMIKGVNMSRIAEICVNGGSPVDVYLSKGLAEAVFKIIGNERFNDPFITLKADEVQDVIIRLVQILDEPLFPGNITYQSVNDRTSGYQKLSAIMWWWNENKDSGETLTFA